MVKEHRNWPSYGSSGAHKVVGFWIYNSKRVTFENLDIVAENGSICGETCPQYADKIKMNEVQISSSSQYEVVYTHTT